MENQPLVSIITPCYNHEKYLNDYFESIIKQTYKKIELIIIDDNSQDKSVEVIINKMDYLKKRFERVIFLRREENIGVVKNCNEGLENAKGKYVCFFASDDLMLPKKVEDSVKYLERNTNFGMVYSNVITQKDKKKKNKFPNYKKMPSGNIFTELLKKENFIPAPSVCIRKSVFDDVGNFDENIEAEDYPMWLKISEKYPIGYINDPLAVYRIHKNSLSHSKEFKRNILDEKYELKKGLYKENKVSKDEWELIKLLSFFRYARIAFFNGDIEGFQRYFNRYKKVSTVSLKRAAILNLMNISTKNCYFYNALLSIYFYFY